MKKCNLKKVLLGTLCCSLIACQKGRSLSNASKLSIENKETYLMSKTSLERLILMQEGLFTLYLPSRTEALRLKSGDS